MKSIGGFFELEVAPGTHAYHVGARAFSTARACLTVILMQTSPSKVYIPFYTCDALIEPIVTLNIPYEFYSIDERFEPIFSSTIKDDETFIYINYFGLCGNIVEKSTRLHGSKLIVDNTQAFFEKNNPRGWSFNSARKFFGVPDGAYLYGPHQIENQPQRNTDFHFAHLIDRLSGKQQQAYLEFIAYERSLSTTVSAISLLSERLLSNIDYLAVAQKRRANFKQYEFAFESINRLKLKLDDHMVPFAYPLLLDHPIDKQRLFEQQIYIPTYWQDTLTRNIDGFNFEKTLSQCLLPLPVDHRYGPEDCERVIEAINQLMDR